MTASRRIILNCDREGCNRSISVPTDRVVDSRLIASRRGWTQGAGKTDYCRRHSIA